MGFATGGLRFSLPDRTADRRWGLGLDFVGAQPIQPVARGRTEARFSYFTGDRDEWVTGLPGYTRVAYRDLWPNVDLVYTGSGSRLKYSLLVHSGADPSRIRMAWRGATGLAVNARGQLEVDTPAGQLVDDRPFSYQVVDRRRVGVPSAYAVEGRSYGFDVGPYDPSRPLVIDPAVFVYAGYIGGDSGTVQEIAYDVAVDGTGAAYIAGVTPATQATFPEVGGPDITSNGGNDAFVAKLNPAGTALVYAGFIGGSGDDTATGIAIDGAGAAYVTGQTGSSEATFPELGGPDLTQNGDIDAFVAKVNPSGLSLAFAGFIGGSLFDGAIGIAVDGTGASYLAGEAVSDQTTFPDGDPNADDTFPVPGVDSTYNGGTRDVFVAKLGSSGAFVNVGYIGGSGTDRGLGIAVDGTGAAYVSGHTDSTEATFPEVGGPDLTYDGGTNDAFVAKVNASQLSLAYAGYIGGLLSDQGVGIAVDGTGAAYITGLTQSNEGSFPDGDGFGAVPGPDQSFNGGMNDAFVAKVTPVGTSLAYAGFIGGAGDSDVGFGVAVDGTSALVSGITDSTEATFPVANGPDGSYNGGDADAFVAKLAPAGTSLTYAGYIGGTGVEIGIFLAVDATGAAYVPGITSSTEGSFPDGDGFGTLPGPDQSYNGGDFDGFIVKVTEPAPPPPPPGPTPPSGATCTGKPATVTGTAGNDSLTGTSGADVIAGLGGNDTISSSGGADVVCAGDGNDKVNGGGGKDKVFGEAGNDKLKGASGNDRLRCGPGKDLGNGGSGVDKASKCEKEKSIP